jgi:hypothetical protein
MVKPPPYPLNILDDVRMKSTGASNMKMPKKQMSDFFMKTLKLFFSDMDCGT